jgi:hypothetical protein
MAWKDRFRGLVAHLSSGHKVSESKPKASVDIVAPQTSVTSPLSPSSPVSTSTPQLNIALNADKVYHNLSGAAGDTLHSTPHMFLASPATPETRHTSATENSPSSVTSSDFPQTPYTTAVDHTTEEYPTLNRSSTRYGPFLLPKFRATRKSRSKVHPRQPSDGGNMGKRGPYNPFVRMADEPVLPLAYPSPPHTPAAIVEANLAPSGQAAAPNTTIKAEDTVIVGEGTEKVEGLGLQTVICSE